MAKKNGTLYTKETSGQSTHRSYRRKKSEEAQEQLDTYMKEKCAIIGKNLRIQRRKRRFSIDNLAEFTELSPSYVGLLERGDRCPSLKSLFKLCDLFGVTPDALLVDYDDPNMGRVSVSEAVARQKSNYDAILSLLYGLDENSLAFVMETIKNLRRLTRKFDEVEANENSKDF